MYIPIRINNFFFKKNLLIANSFIIFIIYDRPVFIHYNAKKSCILFIILNLKNNLTCSLGIKDIDYVCQSRLVPVLSRSKLFQIENALSLNKLRLQVNANDIVYTMLKHVQHALLMLVRRFISCFVV